MSAGERDREVARETWVAVIGSLPGPSVEILRQLPAWPLEGPGRCDREARDIDLSANPAVVLWDVETRLRPVLPPITQAAASVASPADQPEGSR